MNLLRAASVAAELTVGVGPSSTATSTTDVLRQAAERGIRYALLRPAATNHSDVDVLVHPADRTVMARFLQQKGFQATPSLRHWPHQLFAKLADDGDWQVFDVLDRVIVGGAWLGGRPLAARLVNRSKADGEGLRQLSADDRVWATWLHAAFRGDLAEIPSAPVEHASPLAGAIDQRAGGDVSRRMVAASSAGDATAALALARVVRDRKRPFSARWQEFGARWSDRAPHRFGRRKGRTAGCTIALIGPDGAGKSTLAAGIRDDLPLPVHLIYMGVFRTDARQLAWRRIPGGGLLVRLCRLWWRSTRASYHRSRGHVVVFDRYVFDATLRPGRRGLRARLSYWLLERSCPPPDLVLVLDAPGDVMFARKNEHDAKLLEERRQHYLAFAARLPQAKVLDATMGREQVLRAAIAHIWKALTAA